MKYPLTLHHLLWRMEHVNAEAEVVTASGVGDNLRLERQTYAESVTRIRRLMAGLARYGIGPGDTVATLAWNSVEHFEALLAVPALGATLNNINLRLQADALDTLTGDPTPSLLIIDAELLGDNALAKTASRAVRRFAAAGTPVAVIGDSGGDVDFDCIGYDDLLAADPAPLLDGAVGEDDIAFLFHSGGTTGPPKTYEVTHRTALLHALSQATVDATGLSRADRVLPLAPFFHVNGWGLPLTSALTGCSLVLPGRDMSARRLARIIRDERVSVAAGVPTIWHDICAAVTADRDLRPRELREVLSGGSPVPLSIVNAVLSVLGASVGTAWGMTETMACSTYERTAPQDSAGRPIPLMELRVVDTVGNDVSGDDSALGRLDVRGPLVIAEPTDPDSAWFATGDVASIDSDGRLTLKDREKDLIKSGGEWIPSAVLEQHLCTHGQVTSAAVVAITDPRWMERPVAYVTLRPENDQPPSPENLRAYLEALVPRWWLPDRIEILSDLPRTSVGKIDKRTLRVMAREPNDNSNGEEDGKQHRSGHDLRHRGPDPRRAPGRRRLAEDQSREEAQRALDHADEGAVRGADEG